MIHKLTEYIKFYNIAKKRARSHKDYLEFEIQQAKMVVDSLEEKGINFEGIKVLDIGSGRGGYAYEFVKRGAKVTALDITNELFQKIKDVDFILGDARRMPFGKNSFDFIFCSSMIEHIKDKEAVIMELARVLKKGGLCYFSFPPFWSPIGAHQFKPFHYLGEKNAVKLSRKVYNVRSLRYDDKYGKLYKTKIRDIEKLIKRTNLKIKKISTRFMPINFAKIPVLNEFLTWHVEFLLKKK